MSVPELTSYENLAATVDRRARGRGLADQTLVARHRGAALRLQHFAAEGDDDYAEKNGDRKHHSPTHAKCGRGERLFVEQQQSTENEPDDASRSYDSERRRNHFHNKKPETSDEKNEG